MEYTRFKNGIEADAVKAAAIESAAFTGVSKAYNSITYISKGVDYDLTAADRAGVVVISMSAASKTLKTGLPLEKSCVVVNVGANAFTLANVAADVEAGNALSLPTGRAALVVVTGSNGTSKVIPLYTPAT